MNDLLHMPTIMLILSTMTFLSCVVAVSMWISDRQNKIVAALAASLLAGTLASACIALRAHVPYFVGITICNAFAVLSIGLIWSSIRIFEHRNANLGIVAVAAVFAALASELSIVREWPQARVIMTSGFNGLFFLLCGLEIARGYQAEPMPTRKLASTIMFLQAAMWLSNIPFLVGFLNVHWNGLVFPTAFKVLFLFITVFSPFSPLAVVLLTRQRYELRLKRFSETDMLTKLNNRRIFMRCAEQLVETVKTPAALILFDIDHFKSINDRHGHAAGDAVLISLAAKLKEECRRGWIPVRLGGEEFACLLPNVSQAEAQAIAETFRSNFEQMTTSHAGHEIACTVSVGVAATGGDIQTVDQLLAVADTRMYFAKHNGRNRVCAEETPELLHHISERMQGFAAHQQLASAVA